MKYLCPDCNAEMVFYLEDNTNSLDGKGMECSKKCGWKTTISALIEEEILLRKWNNDLMSGMYVNCVYCGHRYGPVENTPISMADILKEHIEKCPKHPMSKLKTIVDNLKNARLTQTGWEEGEDVVLLNGEPIGATITRHRIEFNRFWDAVKNKILGKNS